MDIRPINLAKRLKCSVSWLNTIICRFPRIKKIRINNRIYYANVTAYDIIQLEKMKQRIFK